MTTEKCLTFCTSKGYQYAGTEYSQECYCGAQPAAAAAKVAESDCQTPCKGNTTQPCGGGSRLNVYYSTQPVGPQPNPGVNGYGYIGCYTEGTNGIRTLTYAPGGLDGSKMTVAMCVGACKAANYQIAGVEYSGECCRPTPFGSRENGQRGLTGDRLRQHLRQRRCPDDERVQHAVQR